MPAVTQRVKGYTVIYSNLDLKDAANVVARLKELGVPYEIKDEGKAIAVPKEKADQARLGLAEKNLPAGGVVGWEIFDVTKMGATDFDRRIQLIRAISGELSRTIRRIEGVADARVQVVIPETRLFEITKVPVTASVMLRLHPAAELSASQINGIVHLVASSVENLLPENITVVDDTGRILTAKVPVPMPVPSPEVVFITPEVAVITKEVIITKEVVAAPTPEERILLKIRAKRELEAELASKAQELLNKFYPPNSTIVRLEIELELPKEAKKIRHNPTTTSDDYRIKKINAVILVDNRVELTKKLKESTFAAVAGVIGYNSRRGDQIILRKVPFHMATLPPEIVKGQVEKMLPPSQEKPQPFSAVFWRFLVWGLGFVLAIFVILTLVRSFWGRAEVVPEEVEEAKIPSQRRRVESTLVSRIRNLAEESPERIASLLKTWLTE